MKTAFPNTYTETFDQTARRLRCFLLIIYSMCTQRQAFGKKPTGMIESLTAHIGTQVADR